MFVGGDELGGLGIGGVGAGEVVPPAAAAMVAPRLLGAGDGEETRRRGRSDGVASQPRRPLAVAVEYRARRRRRGGGGGREEEEREGVKRGH